MYGHTYSKSSVDQPGKAGNPARDQLNRERCDIIIGEHIQRSTYVLVLVMNVRIDKNQSINHMFKEKSERT